MVHRNDDELVCFDTDFQHYPDPEGIEREKGGQGVKILVLAAVLDAIATLLYLRAIKHENLSKTIPMLC